MKTKLTFNLHRHYSLRQPSKIIAAHVRFMSLLLCSYLLCVSYSLAQPPCENIIFYPAEEIMASSTVGDTVLISASTFAGDYARLNNVQNGKIYKLLNAAGDYITVRDSLDPTVVIAEGPSPLMFSSMSIGNLIHVHYNLDDGLCGEEGVQRVTRIVTCGNPGTAAAPLPVCNSSTLAINLFDRLNDEETGGTWTETSGIMSTGSAFNAANGTFTPDGQIGGNYTFEYLAPGTCGNSASVVIEVSPAPFAGEEQDTVVLFVTDLAVNLFDGLQNADTGGNWAETSTMSSTGFNAATGEFDPMNHAFGVFTFVYTVESTPTSICSGESDAQTVLVRVSIANDDCDGAIELMVNSSCTNTIGNNENATDSRVYDGAPNGCAGYNSDGSEKDVWFKMTLTANQIVKVTGSGISGSDFEEGDMAIYEGVCGNLSQVKCLDGLSPNDYEPITIIQNETAAAKIYYIRYWSYSNGEGDFNICVTEVSATTNDDCSPALQLIVSTNGCVNSVASNIAATASELAQSNIPDPGCGSYVGGDVWFDVTVAAGQAVQIETSSIPNSAFFSRAMALYASDCHGLELLECSSSADQGLSYFNVDSNPIDLKVRLWSTNSSSNFECEFNICAYETDPPPDNYICSNATPLTVGTGFSCTVANTVSGTTINSEGATECGFSNSVWYSFGSNVNADPVIIDISNIVPVNTNGQMVEDIARIGIYSDCEEGTQFTCSYTNLYQFNPTSPETQYLIELSFYQEFEECVGGIIEVGARGASNQRGGGPSPIEVSSFDICLYTCEAPINDDPDDALDISDSDNEVCVVSDNFCADFGFLFYTFTPTVSGPYEISGESTSLQNSLSFSIFPVLGGEESVFQNLGCVNLVAGTEYGIAVQIGGGFLERNDSDRQGFDQLNGTFEFCIEPAQTYATCSVAKEVEIGFCCVEDYIGCADFNQQEPTRVIAEDQDRSNGGCVDPSFPSKWYAVTVPGSGTLSISIFNNSFEGPLLSFEVYTGVCNQLVSIGCGQQNAGSWTPFNPLDPGSIVYLQVSNNTDSEYQEFGLCLDYNANPCPEDLALSGTFSGATVISTASNSFSGNPIGGLISSDQLIANTADAEYSAGEEVDLLIGFEVQLGAQFHAYIEGCEGFIDE